MRKKRIIHTPDWYNVDFLVRRLRKTKPIWKKKREADNSEM